MTDPGTTPIFGAQILDELSAIRELLEKIWSVVDRRKENDMLEDEDEDEDDDVDEDDEELRPGPMGLWRPLSAAQQKLLESGGWELDDECGFSYERGSFIGESEQMLAFRFEPRGNNAVMYTKQIGEDGVSSKWAMNVEGSVRLSKTVG